MSKGKGSTKSTPLFNKVMWCHEFHWTLAEYDEQDHHELEQAEAIWAGYQSGQK